MTGTGSKLHEDTLHRVLVEMSNDGWKTINLHGKCPDGIAVKDGVVVAIEILRYTKRNKSNGKFELKFAGGTSIIGKKELYSMFDDVIVHVVRPDGTSSER